MEKLREFVDSDTTEQVELARHGDTEAARHLLLSVIVNLERRRDAKPCAVTPTLDEWLVGALCEIWAGKDANIALGLKVPHRPKVVSHLSTKRLLVIMQQLIVNQGMAVNEAAKIALHAAEEFNASGPRFPIKDSPKVSGLVKAYARYADKLNALSGRHISKIKHPAR